jgi:hypothetical protein
MSDAQFVGRDPNSPLVAAARRTLAEIADAEPDLLVIDGDLVDEGSPEDFALARSLLDEFDLRTGGKVPWHYVPGNHEAMGPGTTVNFQAEFGDTSSAFQAEFGGTSPVFDDKGTRFITLDTSSGTLRGGGFGQLQLLHDTLADAAADPSVSGVVFFEHHPTEDPLPDKASQLGDRKEAALVEQWLADFRATAHKSAAMVAGHVGAFAASSIDGVPYLLNGNSGKNPASTPDNGGFTGWTMLGIDPADGDVGRKPHGSIRIRHPLTGEMTLRYETFTLSGDQEQSLSTYHAEPGSASAEGLRLLTSWGADASRDWPSAAPE